MRQDSIGGSDRMVVLSMSVISWNFGAKSGVTWIVRLRIRRVN
jgi:hypothetical protein